jgi:Cu/Ag efflux protein CusF
MKRFVAFLLFGFAGLVVLGCGQQAAEKEKEYDVRGRVVKVDADRKTVTIHHDDIPGYLGESDTPFEVQDAGLLKEIAPNDAVQGRLRVAAGSTVLTSLQKVAAGPDDRVQANRARLSPEDRKTVEAQQFCPIQTQNRLGSMGKPVRVVLKGEPVFLCCPGCEEEAAARPEATLAKAQELRQQAHAALEQGLKASTALADNIEKNRARLAPEDRKLVEAQDYCPIQTLNRLGSMGKPVKVMINGQPVFLCCPGCKEEALKYPDGTLAKVEELKRRSGTK